MSTTDPDTTAKLLRTRVTQEPIDVPVTGTSMRGVIESGSTARIVDGDAPRPGEIWAFVDDHERVLVHRIRHVAADLVTGRGTGNLVDDEPVPRTRLIGRVASVRAPSGRLRRFGRMDRRWARLAFTTRAVARRIGLRRRTPRPDHGT